MSKNEQKELIEQAIQLVEEAQSLVDEAVKNTNAKSNYEAYGKYGFDTLLGNGNPYDNSLQTLLENL